MLLITTACGSDNVEPQRSTAGWESSAASASSSSPDQSVDVDSLTKVPDGTAMSAVIRSMEVPIRERARFVGKTPCTYDLLNDEAWKIGYAAFDENGSKHETTDGTTVYGLGLTLKPGGAGEAGVSFDKTSADYDPKDDDATVDVDDKGSTVTFILSGSATDGTTFHGAASCKDPLRQKAQNRGSTVITVT